MEKKIDFEVSLKCRFCGEYTKVTVAVEDFNEFWLPNRRKIQDLFPYLTDAERELFISGTCEKCFNKMFPQEDEED